MRKRLILGVLGHLVAMTPVFGQSTETNQPTEIAPMVVTGSLIPTIDAEGVAPVMVLGVEEIQKSGAATVTEVLMKLPQNNAGTFNEGFLSGNSFSKGSSSVSLRGLGPNATLVLLNGRRLASYGFAQNITDSFIDLNSIPLGAVERVEVLKDGASALYGSDAIAGVINIILKKEYNGTELTTRVANTTEGDALEQLYTATWGVSDEKSSAMMILDYYSRHGLYLRDRDYSRSANHEGQGGYDFSSSSGNPGSILLDDWYMVPSNPAIPGHPTTGEILANPGVNYYDFNPWISALGETERYGAFGSFSRKLTDNLTAFAETSFRHITYRVDAAPTPVFGDLDGFVIPASNPYNPFGEDVTFRHRLTEAGPRISEGDTDVIRLLPGLSLKLERDWTVESALLYSSSRTTEIGKNYISAQALQDALDSTDPATALNLFGAGNVNDPAVINGLKVNTMRQGNSTLVSPDVKAGGTVPINWGAGDVGVALGAEFRSEEIEDMSDPFSEGGYIVSSGGSSGSGSREAWAAYAELGIPVLGEDLKLPLVEQLQLQVAGRYEDYSDFGDTTKPKIGLKWKVSDQLMFRGTYAQGFRAPSLVELFQGRSTSYDELIDSARNETTVYQYRIVRGGNPDLDPEESESWTLGTVIEPLERLTLYADWFRIKQDGKIRDLDPQYILDNEAAFPDRVIRNPQTPADILAGIPGSIVQINSGYENLADRSVEGLDFGVRYVIPTDTMGSFSLDANSSWLYKFDEVPMPGEPVVEYAGTYSMPEWRGSASVYWDYKKLSFGVTANYTGQYDQYYMASSKYIDAQLTYDLQASYELPYNSRLTVGVENVLDEDPPFSDSDSEGYDTSLYDARGRFVYAQLSVKF
jgi:iron complex outermembrane receptor protein